MMDSTAKALRLIAACEETARQLRQPHIPPAVIASMISEHAQLLGELREQLQIMEGFVAEHHQLISLVAELLGTVTAATNGRAEWTSELPPGRAPAFRRALNKAVAYLRGDGERT